MAVMDRSLPGSDSVARQFYELVRSRRSLRRFTAQPVSETTVMRVLEAACWAPSAHNRQPWRFVVLTHLKDKQRLAHAMSERLAADLRADGLDEASIARDTGRSKERLGSAPVLIVVCLSMADMDRYPDQRRQFFEHQMAVQSVAMAAQNLLLAAHAEGLGACWLCAPLFSQDMVRATLGLPDDCEPQGAVVMGYPSESREKTRQSLKTKVIFR